MRKHLNIGTAIVRMVCTAMVILVCTLAKQTADAQTVVSTINVSNSSATSSTVDVTSPSDAGNNINDSESYRLLYGRGNDIAITSYVVAGTTYDRFLRPDTLVLNRRVPSDRLVNIWYTISDLTTTQNPDSVTIDPTATTDADAIYLTGTINAGYDNILVNDDDLAGGSIQVETERVDVIWYQGIQTSSPSTAVFPVIERGGNDNIAVAAITSLNLDGTPASYGTLIGIPETFWPGTGQTFSNYLILRRETAGEEPIPLLNIGPFAGQTNQTVQGVAVSFSELGVSANQSIYGYSIFSADVCDGFTSNTGDILSTGSQTIASGIDLDDISTFPVDTKSDDSGLDLVAGVSAAVASDDNLIETKGPGGYKAALATWLKANEADDVTTSTEGSTVTDWQDHWIGNHDFVTGIAGSAPTYRSSTTPINFNPAVDFTSSSTSLSTGNNNDFNDTEPYTRKGINIAFRTSTSDITTRQTLFEQGGNTRGINIYIRNGNIHVTAWNRADDGGPSTAWNDSGNVTTVSASVSTNTEYIVTLELDGNSGITGNMTAYLNGQSIGVISNVGLLYRHTGGIELGGNDGNTRFDDGSNSSVNSYYGEISEFIYCNEPGSLPIAQRRRIESYLAIKYGITLDQTSPIDYYNSDGIVVFDATNNASIGGYLEYNNDIAGIARDDASEFDQPASRSENTGSVVTIDKGATLSTDDTWLIWGNDGAALTETAALTMPETIISRLNRVWRAAERNESGATSVSFDLTGLGLSSDASDFSLLIAGNSTNADFSSATVLSGGTFNGNTITFTGVDLDDGEYFTLGTQYFQCGPGGIFENLALWLNADNGTSTTTNGSDIATWSDQSGNGNDATAVFGNQPNYASSSINFNPAVNFDEINTEEITGSAGFHSVGYYIVFNSDNTVTSASDEDVLIGFNVPAGATDEFGALALGSVTSALTDEVVTHGIGGTGTRWRRGISSTNLSQVNSNETYMFGVRDNSGATSSEMYINGEELADLSSGTFLTSVNTDYEIGSYTATNEFVTANHFDGQIAEVISYSVRPTDAEHQRIQSYLAVKYGLTLDNSGGGTAGDYTSASGTNIWDASDYSTYHNDVAGIGRDDNSCLSQKQSRSENSGSIVSMGLGTVAASNDANANSFTSDESFLIWGNDGDFANQANANTSDLPGNVTERMERIWRVNETGTVGATTIQFDLTGLGYSSTLSDFQLIVSNSPTMASGSLVQAASLNSNILTFSNIDLTDGQYFTIGTARTACGPAGITSNLALWLRGDAGTNTSVDGADATSWLDQSGNGRNASGVNQGGGAPQTPTFRNPAMNFNPVIRFTDPASSDNAYLETSSNPASGDMTLISVFSTTQTDGTTEFWQSPALIGGESSGNANDYGLGLSGGRIHSKVASGNGLGTRSPASPTYSDGIPHMALATRQQASSGPVNLFVDAENVASGTSDNVSLSDPGGVGIGNHVDPITEAQFAGDISETIVFSSILSADDRTKVETYLAIKYGITRSVADGDDGGTPGFDERDYRRADGTVIWDYSSNTTYHNDVAGIGREDEGCFSQKQSASVNIDDILTIGLGSVAGSNSSNVNGFDDDGDYLVWGNDNGATAQASANTSDVPNSIAERITRVWKVQDTGNVGDTELQFDLTGLGYSVADPSAFSLLVGNTATMADASIITGGTLNGNILSFSGVDLTDGQFFTVGTSYVTCGPGGVNTNIALWLRADQEAFSDFGSTAATDGNNVEQWNDQSSPADNGFESNLFGSNPIEPTWESGEINFNPVLRFSDPNSTNASYIETSSNTVSGDMTLISVFQTGQANGTANDFVNSPALIGASETSSTADYGLGMDNGTIWVNANTNSAFDAETSNTFNDNEPHFVTATRVQSSGAINIFVNSNSEASGTGSTSALTAPTSFGIGNHSDGDVQAQFAGDIAETIVFSSTLDSEERNRVETYLALKYGITRNAVDDGSTGGVDERDYRAADGGVIWDYDGQSTTYYNDIFGIGRDDLSCLEQTQSKSENDDALVTFNLSGGFGTNDSFLLSGNDNANIEGSTNEKPAGINSRLLREWRVQETGTVGTISLTYDLSTITGPTGIGTNNLNLLRLLVDDDGDFSSGATLIAPSSINGTNETATFNVNFTNGQYYTLGSTETAALPITLLYFSVKASDDNEVNLSWATIEENGNAFFSIERSSDGLNFETIGTREGAGNSTDLIEYRFLDTQPLNGIAFYRLKQTDFNGESEYSEVQRVLVSFEALNDYRIYPNPLIGGETLKLGYSVDSDQPVTIEVIATNGTRLTTLETTLHHKNNSIEIPFNYISKGLHFIRITTMSGRVSTLKLLVQ